MEFRQIQAISEGQRGAFGHWLTDYLKTMSKQLRDSASRMVVENLKDQNERNDMLAQSNIIEDLVTQIPSKIDEIYKELQGKSNE